MQERNCKTSRSGGGAASRSRHGAGRFTLQPVPAGSGVGRRFQRGRRACCEASAAPAYLLRRADLTNVLENVQAGHAPAGLAPPPAGY